MLPGDTFLIDEPGTALDTHLWVVLSRPERGRGLVCVNLTSLTDFKDQSCTLRVGDHPWIKHESCVNYEQPRILQVDQLDKFAATKLIKQQEPLAKYILDKVYMGAASTKRIPLEVRKILYDQGLLPL